MTRGRLAFLAALTLAAGGAVVAAPATSAAVITCAPAKHPGGDWRMYGHDLANTRTQEKETTIGLTEAPTLSPAWSFSAAEGGGNGDFTGTPVVADGCVYMASNRGFVFAINADTGEKVWTTKLRDDGGANASVGAFDGKIFVAVSRISSPYVTALDQRTGKQLWVTVLDKQAGSDVYGSPMVHDGVLFMGWSAGSAELGDEGDRYAFQGGFMLIDAKSGKVLKKTWTVHAPDPNQENPKDFFAGGAIWSTPAIDPVTKAAYVGAGNPFRPQAEHKNTNSILKIDMNRKSRTFGKIVASYKGQVDEYFPAISDLPCLADIPGNPAPYYPQGLGGCADLDMDFGAAPNLFTDANGQKLVGAGQKSGVYHVMDAKTMAPVRTTLVGPPSAVGGIVGSTAYVDGDVIGPIVPAGYMWSLDANSGLPNWFSPIVDGAHWGNPVSVANGVAYTTDLKGFLDAYDVATGAPLLHRPMKIGSDANADPMLSWGGVAIARNTVYAAVGMTALDNGYVVAFKPGIGVPGLPGGGGGGGPGLPANAGVVSGPMGQFYGYLTPAVTYSPGSALSYTNADIVSHDVIQDPRVDGVAGPNNQPWCKNFAKNECPIFWTPLQGLTASTDILGLENAKSGSTYNFYCSLHPGMKGQLVVL